MNIQSKVLITAAESSHAPSPPPLPCRQVFKALGAFDHVSKLSSPHPKQIASLVRRLKLIGIEWTGDLSTLHDLRQQILAALTKNMCNTP